MYKWDEIFGTFIVLDRFRRYFISDDLSMRVFGRYFNYDVFSYDGFEGLLKITKKPPKLLGGF
jgi:hypothetical protein